MISGRIIKAKYYEYEASLFGASVVFLSLGALFTSLLRPFVGILLVVGVALHLWGMYKIHTRNK